ncbi:glycosyltransferase family 2 protein [uncultured Paenibacillus sp.]|uniref:glycosyltransferase family 2 protein n=1 Tax=uncultured Paenibacillus sp. TaxID=227322 RepID=UPI0015AF20F4|nr:glycosyltransferase family 2 protein [uncultured Paenibacillus sp.]
MKRLSMCMIVKDEEALLPRCLESVKGIADEIIVVDTGSTDRTKEIAALYTNLIFDYQWGNDFAAARNESLRHATGKWILVMDADEYLSTDDHNKWLAFLDNEKPLDHLAYTLPIINFTGDKEYQDEISASPVTRLFPNHKGIYFERPIHEQLTRGSQGELFHKKLDLNIYHTGYQNLRVDEKNKHERNMQIFKQMQQKGEMSEYDWFTLGNQYRYAKDEIQAIACYERAMNEKKTNLVWYPHCLVGLITLYYKQNKLEQSWKLTESKLSEYRAYAEYHAIRGVHYETMGFFDEAITCYLEAIDTGESRAKKNQEIWLVDPMYSFDMPVQQLIEVYFRKNDNQQAVFWLSKLLNKNKKNPNVLLKLVEWLCHNDSPESVIRMLNQTYELTDESDKALLFKVSLALGRDELVNYYQPSVKHGGMLSPADQIRFALIQQNKQGWRESVQASFGKGEDTAFHVWLQALLGAMIWDEYPLLEQLVSNIKDKDVVRLNYLIVQGLKNSEISNNELEIDADKLFVIARQLFLLKQFELFDRFVQRYQTRDLVNQLANFFYSINLIDLAMNYYSILLSQQALDFNSLENLGLYHAYQNYPEETVEFLREALRAQPKARHLYYFLIRNAESQEKTKYIELFKSELPELTSISFIADFIKQQSLA